MPRAATSAALGFALALVAGLPSRATGEDMPPYPKSPAAPVEAPPPDAMAQALADAGLTVDDLGFRPQGTWARYPNVVPFKMPFFDDLLAHPLDTYEFTRTLGNAVEDLLTPEKLRAAPEKDKPESLFSLGVALATDRRIGGFRGFGINLLDEKVREDEPIHDGIGLLLDVAWTEAVASGREIPASMLEPYGLPLGHGQHSMRPKVIPNLDDLPAALRLPIGRLLAEMAASIRWILEGLRNVPARVRAGVWNSLPTLVSSTPDGNRFFAEIEDAANQIDQLSLAYGALKALAAVQRARREIDAVRPKDGWGKFRWIQTTPFGRIWIEGSTAATGLDLRGGSRDYRDYSDAPLLFIATEDLPPTIGPLGSCEAGRPLSVALIMGAISRMTDGPAFGSDRRTTQLPNSGSACGILGCGIVYSAGAHNTVYESTQWGLGAGLLGIGVLVDEGGNDTYRVHDVGEGAAMFGAGLLLDAAGDDKYELLGGDGQGFGGPGGIGVLADRSGNDHYYAEPLPEKAGKERADYHSIGKIVGSNAQGAGMGRRGDISDGHAWAGGLGALLDIDGDDVYEAGNFSQGVGYWFGTGLLYDGGGSDVYRSVYFSHGSGAHFAVGAVVDEGGDDQHLLFDWPKVDLSQKPPGAGIAFGWDVVNAFVFDRAGNDRYEAGIISEGVSNVRSMAFLLDEGGDDTYVADSGALAFGAVDEMPTYTTPHRTAPFAFHLPQVAMLLDLGGADQYLRRGADGHLVPDAIAGEGKAWGGEAPRGPVASGAGRNVAIGRDVARGHLGFLDAWPRRVAPAAPVAAPAAQPAAPGTTSPPSPAAPATPEPAMK